MVSDEIKLLFLNMSAFVHRGGMTETTTQVIEPGKSGDAAPASTPLQDFVKAKEKIDRIFVRIQQFVNDVHGYLDQLSAKEDFACESAMDESRKFAESVEGIRAVLKRDHMKVVFFGRTSNGKSTCINAMLHSKVLPSGMGHTTRCFLQVEGSEDQKRTVVTESSSMPRSIDSIDELAHALKQSGDSTSIGEDALVKIFWPKSDSRLLNNEVVLVDSPGVDVTPEFDDWIDRHCLDANVFVLVCNAESTLTQTEKNFFHRVSSKLSKPKLFILNNRWDASADEPETMDRVRQQHTSRLTEFLVDELQVCTREEAKNRIFFVSAKEMLQARLRDRGAQSPGSTGMFAEGYQVRMMEFSDFERQFELLLSHSAISTKFANHVEKGKAIVDRLHSQLENVSGMLEECRNGKISSHRQRASELREAQTAVNQYLDSARHAISILSDEVQLKIVGDVREEIRQLSDMIDSFTIPMVDDQLETLHAYKHDLNAHMDQRLTEDLMMRVHGGGALQRVLQLEHELINNMTRILPPSYGPSINQMVQYREPFSFSFALNCPALMESFTPDLQFRFSLGPTALMRRFSQLKTLAAAPVLSPEESNARRQRVLFGNTAMINALSAEPNEKSVYGTASASGTADSMMMHSIVYTSAAYIANGGVGLVVVGGLVYRTVGWRIVALIGSLYGLLYAYEYLSWTSRAKESQYKDQYRSHLASALKHIGTAVASNAASQVTRELQEHFTRLQDVGCSALNEMKAEVDRLHKEATELDKLSQELATTSGSASSLKNDLDGFEKSYL